MLAEQKKPVLVDDDSFMDWETRHESIPFYRHMIAGNIHSKVMKHFFRIMCWYNGACWNVSS